MKVYLADDHEACRLGLKLTVLLDKTCEIAGEAASGVDLADKIDKSHADLALIDLSLPGKDGFQVLRELKRMGSKTKVIIWSAHDDIETVSSAVRSGVNGYLCKGCSMDVMRTAMKEVMNGQQWIDPSVAFPMPPSMGCRPAAINN